MNKVLRFAFLAVLVFSVNPEIYAGRSWYQKASVGGDGRHRSTAFSIGNKGYYGGGHINSGSLITYQDYWEYDPATNSWTQIADYGGGQRYHATGFTIGKVAYVGCGENGTHDYTNDIWKYVPEVNTWFPIADFPGVPRRGAAAFVIDDIAYFGTGQCEDCEEGYEIDFFKYDPVEDLWTPISDFIGNSRSASVCFAYDGKGYLGTGHKVGEALNDFYMYDPLIDEWFVKTSVGGSIRQEAIGFCIDGKGYIGTGDDNLGTDFKDMWEYDFDADTWTQVEDFKGQKRRYAVNFIINDVVYVGGGTDGTNFKDFWAFAPTLSIDEQKQGEFNFSLYPNPSNDIITVSVNLPSSVSQNISLSISDISGRIIQNVPFNNETFTLHKNDFEKGIYFLNVSVENQLLNSYKFIFN